MEDVMQTLALFNMKGGVGKTTAAVNLAWHSAADLKRTLLWDLDPQGSASFYVRADGDDDARAHQVLLGRLDAGAVIRRSPWGDLDVLPADFEARHADLALDDLKKARKRLARAAEAVKGRYDRVFFDCPPNLSLLSDNVLRAAHFLLVPMVPSPLSLASWARLEAHLAGEGVAPERVIPFFCMVDGRKTLHRDLVLNPPSERFCRTAIPYLSVIERMGVERAPVAAFAPRSQAARAFARLWAEIRQRVDGAGE
jgi:cellulose biosynthesis protein BcsQ